MNSKGVTDKSGKVMFPLMIIALPPSRTSSVSTSISLYIPGKIIVQSIGGSEIPVSRLMAYGPSKTIFSWWSLPPSPSGLNLIFSIPIIASVISMSWIPSIEALFNPVGEVADLKVTRTLVSSSGMVSLHDCNINMPANSTIPNKIFNSFIMMGFVLTCS